MPLFETETVINATEFDMFVNSYMRSLVYDSDLINTTAGDNIKAGFFRIEDFKKSGNTDTLLKAHSQGEVSTE